MHETGKDDTWIKGLIISSSALFIVILALSAFYESSIRVLHFFQAFIYVAVIVLAVRRSAWGYGAGCFIATFWNWTNLVHTTFIANGIRELSRALHTGQVQRPDQLIAVFAATAHFVLIGSCVIGYFRIKPKTPLDPVKFLAGGLVAVGYLVAIIFAFGPQYVPLLRRVLHV